MKSSLQFSSVQLSRSVMSDSLWPQELQTPGLPVRHQLPEFTQIHVHGVGDAIQPSHPLSSPSPPTFNLSQHRGLFQWVLHIKWPEYWSFSFSISPSNEHSGLILYDKLVGSPCSPRDSQESSPTPQFKSINSSVLSFLYSPTLTSIHDCWKNRISMWIKNFQICNLDLQKADEPKIKLPTFVGL